MVSKQLHAKEATIVEGILKLGLQSGEFHFLDETEINKVANVIVSVLRGLLLYLFLDNDDYEQIDIVTKLISEGI